MDDHALGCRTGMTNKRNRGYLSQHVVIVNARECEVAAGRAGLEIPAPSPVSKQHCSRKCARFVGVPAVEQPPARGICECDILEQRMSRVQRSRVLRLL